MLNVIKFEEQYHKEVLYLDKQAKQGKGYGSDLLKEVEEKIKSKNYKKIVLETAEFRPKTLEFYKKMDI